MRPGSWAGHKENKPVKAGKTIKSNNYHTVFSIFCVPVPMPCELSNLITHLMCWISFCTPQYALYSSPSCSLLRNNGLCGERQRALSPKGTGRREERRERWLFTFQAASGRLAVSARPSTQSHSSCQMALLSSSPSWVQKLLLALCPFRSWGDKSCLLFLVPEDDCIPDGQVQPYPDLGKDLY